MGAELTEVEEEELFCILLAFVEGELLESNKVLTALSVEDAISEEAGAEEPTGASCSLGKSAKR